MIDYDNIEVADATPDAYSQIETYRAIGYSLPSAVADIVDNSITAGANKIVIKRFWKGGESSVTISDDGIGMNNQELIQAMKPGSKNPLLERKKEDLGRFGLGLKTASFSQCRKLTVLSKKKGESPIYWTWDLDYVAKTNKWNLIKWIPEQYKDALDNQESGTIVIWNELDRIVPQNVLPDNEEIKEKFSKSLDIVRRHLAMTFHRFIEDKSVSLFWSDHPIEPWNPFCPEEDKRQTLPADHLPGGVTIQGYILPHKSNFSSDAAYTNAEGLNGWVAQQGFYVYRGKRLLMAGDWLGMFKKEEHTKLVRILVDLPNSLDEQWQIDIKKSKACPPVSYREQLLAYAKDARNGGEKVFRHRGKILKQRAGHNFQPLWLEKISGSTWTCVINRENDIINGLKELAKEDPDKAFGLLLSLLETNIPTKTIYIHESKNEENLKESAIDNIDTIKESMKFLYDRFISKGRTPQQAKNGLMCIEPYNKYEDLIDTL